jgi:hypothetical protein
MRFRECACVLLVFGLASASTAAVSVEWVPVDNTDALTGYTTVDLFFHSDTGLCCGALLVELQQGDIFYFTYGVPGSFPYIEADKNRPPQQALIDIGASIPEFLPIAYTSYVTINAGPVYMAGGAGDVGGDGLAFTDTEIDASWFSFDYPFGAVHMARLTFSNDSVGTWGFATVNEQNEKIELYGSVGGLIPEPGTFLFVLGGFAAVILRL